MHVTRGIAIYVYAFAVGPIATQLFPSSKRAGSYSSRVLLHNSTDT